jgi:GNAT superfamily N-acetyltransferase
LKPVSVFHIEPLTRGHDRTFFDCGEPALNDYIKRHARQNQDRGIGRTYVAAEADGVRVFGFYTIASASIRPRDLAESERRRLPRYRVPMVQVARLAVDSSARGQGLGESLLYHALQLATRAADMIGIFGVEVYAKHETAAAFYRRFGFVPLEDDRLHLYLPVHTARTLIESS